MRTLNTWDLNCYNKGAQHAPIFMHGKLDPDERVLSEEKKLSKKELEELRYDTATAILRGMSPGSVFQYALDRQLQLMELYGEEELRNLYDQYKMYDPTTKKQKKSGGGMK